MHLVLVVLACLLRLDNTFLRCCATMPRVENLSSAPNLRAGSAVIRCGSATWSGPTARCAVLRAGFCNHRTPPLPPYVCLRRHSGTACAAFITFSTCGSLRTGLAFTRTIRAHHSAHSRLTRIYLMLPQHLVTPFPFCSPFLRCVSRDTVRALVLCRCGAWFFATTDRTFRQYHQDFLRSLLPALFCKPAVSFFPACHRICCAFCAGWFCWVPVPVYCRPQFVAVFAPRHRLDVD